MLLFNHPLNSAKMLELAYEDARNHNLGAITSFVGIVRAEINEDGQQVDGLSFDINQALLQDWFNQYQQRQTTQLRFYFAHAIGDVMASECSYFAAIASHKREMALSLLSEFVEDFKHNAPIWKYDLVKGNRIYALKRSFVLPNAGILAR